MSEKYVDASTKKICKEGWTERELNTKCLNFVNELMKMTTRSIKYFQKNRSKSFSSYQTTL